MISYYRTSITHGATILFFLVSNLAQAQTNLDISNAKDLLSNGNTKAAVSKLESAWETNRQNFELCQLLVDAYGDRIDQINMLKKRGLAKKMLRAMEQCYALKPDNENAQLNLIMFHIQAPSIVGGDKAEAKRLIQEVSETYPVRGLLMQARLAVLEKDFETAASYVDQAIHADPDNSEAFNVAGLIALQEEKYTEAVRLFRRCVTVEPEQYDCHYQIGKTAHLSGQNAEAGIAAFEIFISHGHDDPEYLAHAHYRLAELLILDGNPSKAIIHLETAIELGNLKLAKKRLSDLIKN